jgi:hypothetical protein
MDQPKTTGGLKTTMDQLSPEGWEIRIGGPRLYVVTTPEPLDPSAVEKIEGHFWANTRFRYVVGAVQ